MVWCAIVGKGPIGWNCWDHGALALWCFSPNILAHGQLVTPDIGATAMGLAAGYFFWHWLTEPGWSHAGIAGLAMGLAELTRTNWIILFALWPVAWLIWMWAPCDRGRGRRGLPAGSYRSFCCLAYTCSTLATFSTVRFGRWANTSLRALP